MTIYERIRSLRLDRGWSMEELAKKVGYGCRSTIAKVENGERLINHEMLIKYAEVFNISPMWLLFGDDTTSVGEFRPVRLKRFTTLDSIEGIDADFCFKAHGDSMIGARINDGDVVFVKKQSIVNNGEIAVVAIGDEVALKYWYYYPVKNKLVLNTANPEFEPQIYTGSELDEVHCLGKAVSFMSSL